MLGECLDRVRQTAPLVHNITNYVTANDVANVLLACGASPIMADDEGEAAEITALCAALTLNIGTLNRRSVPAMYAAGRRANALGRPVVLDPVGVGASALRTGTARGLLEEIRFSAVRGNMSEVLTLARAGRAARGVDADSADAVTEENLLPRARLLMDLAGELGTILAVTGAIDLVTDGARCLAIRNGRREMGFVTGTGCQLSALLAAFLAANPDRPLEGAAAAVCAMGLAGELAFERLAPWEGNMAYRDRIIDMIYHMTGEILEKGGRIEVVTG